MNKEKQQFFTQYWGQKVFYFEGVERNYIVNTFSIEYTRTYLLLRELKNITPEDAIELCNLIGMFSEENLIAALISGDRYVKDFKDVQKAVDFLRSKGYALPWRQYSVQELINNDWIKIC
jgi:hypothetical protein